MAIYAHLIIADKYLTCSQETYTKFVCMSFRISLHLMVYELRCKRDINDKSQVRKHHLCVPPCTSDEHVLHAGSKL